MGCTVIPEDKQLLMLNDLSKQLTVMENNKSDLGSHRTRWKKRSALYRKELSFPAVYKFCDEYDNLLYIGKASDFAYRMVSHFKDGHLSSEQYDRVKKVMYSRCNSDTDAAIIELALLSYYKPEFNQRDMGSLPTVVSIEDIIGSLHWETYVSDDAAIDVRKDDLYRQLRDFDSWSFNRQKEFVENKYDEYIVKHRNDDLSVRQDNDELFKIVLTKAIGSYNVLSDRKRLCDIIQQSYLPDLEHKWFNYCYKKMCIKNFYKYGDVWWAFAHNYYASLSMICALCLAPFVVPLAVYAFDCDGCNSKDELNSLLFENSRICSVSSYKELYDEVIDGQFCLDFKCDMMEHFVDLFETEYANYLSSDLVDNRGHKSKVHFARLCGLSISHVDKLFNFDPHCYYNEMSAFYY